MLDGTANSTQHLIKSNIRSILKMTNVNYTKMSNQELLDIIDLELSRLHSPNKSTFRFRCYELYSELVKRTSFLDNEV